MNFTRKINKMKYIYELGAGRFSNEHSNLLKLINEFNLDSKIIENGSDIKYYNKKNGVYKMRNNFPLDLIIKAYTNSNVNYNKPVKIKSLDFSKWLKKNIKKTDYVVVKMNIEGSEYLVLEKLIKEKTIKLISQLYLYFHSSKFKNSLALKEKEKELIDKLKKYDLELYVLDPIFK